MPPNSPDEALRLALRTLFARAYATDTSPIQRQVAYKRLQMASDDTLGDVLLQDLIRGSFAELLLRAALGDTLDALIIHIRAGETAKARALLEQTPVDGAALADLLSQDLTSLVSNARIDLAKRGAAPGATADLLNAPERRTADLVRDILTAEGETRAAGMSYLRQLSSHDAIPALLEALNDETLSIPARLDAIGLLVGLNDRSALPTLQALARNADATPLRGAALLAAADINGTPLEDALHGAVRKWASHNRPLARAVVSTFGDEPDPDTFLHALMQPTTPEADSRLAAAALVMSGSTDYALAVLRFLNHDDHARDRWGDLLRWEAATPEAHITDFFADRLRDEAQQARLAGHLDDSRRQLMNQLMLAMVRFNNERGKQALSSIQNNPSLPDDLRRAATKAIDRLNARKDNP